jgi:hypothetical protein
MKAIIKLKPILDTIEVSQNKLNLSNEEMNDLDWLKQYISDYHTPFGYEVINIEVCSV